MNNFGKIRGLLELTMVTLLFLLAALTVSAQQITGTPGSPSATTTIDGKYLPSPPSPFGGVINLNAAQVPFQFTGKIEKSTISLEPPLLTPEDIKRLQEAEQSAEDDR